MAQSYTRVLTQGFFSSRYWTSPAQDSTTRRNSKDSLSDMSCQSRTPSRVVDWLLALNGWGLAAVDRFCDFMHLPTMLSLDYHNPRFLGTFNCGVVRTTCSAELLERKCTAVFDLARLHSARGAFMASEWSTSSNLTKGTCLFASAYIQRI